MESLTELGVIPLINGLDYDWSSQPPSFRHIATSKRLSKLVRNSDSTRLAAFALGKYDVKIQKTDLQAALSSAPDDVRYACIFNGIDLLILGQVDMEEVRTQIEGLKT